MSLQKDLEKTEEKTLKRFVDFRKARVLEIGCGEGRLTWKYARASARTVGIDPDHSALRVAQADSPDPDKIHFTGASARNMPFRKETFDIAILAWSL